MSQDNTPDTSAGTSTDKPAYYSPKFFKGSVVRALIKEHNRRVSPEFLSALDQHIERLVKKACETETGKKTLDGSAAETLGLNQ